MTTRHSLALCALTLALAPLAGCSGVRKPDVRVIDAALPEITADGYVVHVRLEAENPNDTALSLRWIDYTVRVNDSTVFAARRSPEATLRRFGSQQIILPAAFPLPAAAKPAPGDTVTVSGTVTYITPDPLSQILFDEGVRQPSVQFQSKARIETNQ